MTPAGLALEARGASREAAVGAGTVLRRRLNSVAAPSTVTRPRALGSLTGIRGAAALWVLCYHAQQQAGSTFGLPQLERIPEFRTGWHGVDLFFILSGFILMYAHERDFARLEWGNAIRFARLRFLRIYPVNAAVLLLIAGMVALEPGYVLWARSMYGPHTYTAGAFVATLLLATRWFIPVPGDWNQPVWSLSLEVLGYAVFPLLAWQATKIRSRWALAAIAAASLGAGALILRWTSYEGDIMQPAVVRLASCFVAGIAVYRLWRLTEGLRAVWPRAICAAAVTGIVLSSAGLLQFGPAAQDGSQMNFLFAAMLYGLAFERGGINRLLASRAAVFLGRISFPLYLVHMPMLLWLRYTMLGHASRYSTAEKAAALAAWAVASVGVATLLHVAVEKPCHRLARQWAGSRAGRPTSPIREG